MSNDEQPTIDSGFQYNEHERSNKEAIVVTLLFVGVIGMSMALVGLDIDMTAPAAEQVTPEKVQGEAVDAAGLFDTEALAKASMIPPGQLVTEASEALIAEILYEDEPEDMLAHEPAAVDEPEAEQPAQEPEASAEKPAASRHADPYSDLVMVGDAETPLRDAQGQQVKLTTPKTQVTNSPRDLLPDAPPDKESKERANNPMPRDAERKSASATDTPSPSSPAPKPAGSSDDLKTQMSSAKSKLRAGDPVGAAKDYKKALAMGGGGGARLGLAKAQYEMGNTKQAQRELKKVLAGNPRSGGALLLMGSISQGQGDRAGARAYYQKFLDTHPSSKRADRIRGILTRL